MLKKGDLIFIVLIIAVSISLYLYNSFINAADKNTNLKAQIIQDNKIIQEIDLSAIKEPERIKISGSYDEVILVEKNRIRFEEADCPNKICVKTGWLSKKGDTAVCLPNKTIIKIMGESNELDGVAY